MIKSDRQELAGKKAVDAAPITRSFRYRVIKRAIDVIAAGLCLVLAAPLFLLTAAVVRLSSPGPIFYRWNVVGRCGRPFRAYKFRTMVRDADTLRKQLGHLNEMTGPVFKLADDPRVTRVGYPLRKFSIDELPQLWSVLKGDMSLVGPRPLLQHEWAACDDRQRRKLSLTPGMTCTWQVKGRNSIADFARWVQLDLDYIDNWSLRTDFRILAETVSTVFRGTGR